MDLVVIENVFCTEINKYFSYFYGTRWKRHGKGVRPLICSSFYVLYKYKNKYLHFTIFYYFWAPALATGSIELWFVRVSICNTFLRIGSLPFRQNWGLQAFLSAKIEKHWEWLSAPPYSFSYFDMRIRKKTLCVTLCCAHFEG